MARPRTPLDKATATGRTKMNPARFAGRSEPKVSDPLGSPPEFLNQDQATAWNTFSNEIPWLNKSHRSILEIASICRAQLVAGGEIPTSVLTLLKQCLGQLGATPADASKASMPAPVEDDSTAEFFS